MSGDILDDLLDADVPTNDVFRDVDTNMEVLARRASPGLDGAENSLGLGIDEEVKITKKRKPLVKLDENRLLSQAGIPKLRRIAKERFRFKGKGHEYSDVARLLSIYQLWLDDLYPRAKFADGLAIIEKLGHTKRIQTMRREWINEGKPRDLSDGTSRHDSQISTSKQKSPEPQNGSPTLFDTQGHPKQPNGNVSNNEDDNDLYSATPPRKPRERTDIPSAADIDNSLFLSVEEDKDLEERDELDALLAEDFQETSAILAHDNSVLSMNRKDEELEDDFDNDVEAMAEMDGIW